MHARLARPVSAPGDRPRPRAGREWLWGAVLLALAVRLLLLAYLAPEPRKLYAPDSPGYHALARNLIRHGVFSPSRSAPFRPETMRTPGYPGVVAGVFLVAGESAAAVALLHAGLAGLTVAIAARLARSLGAGAVAAVVAAWLAALEPASVFHSVLLLTETAFTLAVTGSLALLARHLRTGGSRALLGSAALLGTATLIRPIALVLPLVVLPVLLLGATGVRGWTRLGRGLAFLLAAALLPAAWAARNAQTGAGFTVSTIPGQMLYYQLAAAVLADERGLDQAAALRELRALTVPPGHQGWPPAAERRAAALALLARSPGHTLHVLLRGAGRLLVDPAYTQICTLLDPGTLALECFPGRSTRLEPGILARIRARTAAMSGLQQGALAAGLLVLAVTYLGAVAGAVRLVAERRWRALALLAVPILYFVLLSAVPADSRFRVPVAPLLAILAGLGWEGIRTVRQRGAAERPDPAA